MGRRDEGGRRSQEVVHRVVDVPVLVVVGPPEAVGEDVAVVRPEARLEHLDGGHDVSLGGEGGSWRARCKPSLLVVT